MELGFLIILVYQSIVQSAFFSFYYPLEHKVRNFLFYMGLFILMIYPLDTLFPVTWVLQKNIFNVVFLGVMTRIVFRSLKTPTIIMGTVLYEIGLVLSEITTLFILYVVFKDSPDPGRFNADHTHMYIFGSLMLTIVYSILLQVFPSRIALKKKKFVYLISLLLNIGFTALCGAFIVVPKEHVFFSRSYGVAITILIGFNILTLLSLQQFIRHERARRSLEALEATYQNELANYTVSHQDDLAWRRLRHDLLNFWEATKEEES